MYFGGLGWGGDWGDEMKGGSEWMNGWIRGHDRRNWLT